MRLPIFGALLLPALTHALEPPHIPGYAPFTTLYPTGSETPIYTPPSPTPTAPSPPLQTPSDSPPPQSPNSYFLAKHPLPGPLHEFIAHLAQSPLVPEKLEQRQNGGVGGGVAGAAPVPPNQVSPITTLYVSGKLVVYTQLFVAVPDQGPTPLVGSVGMGTLTGNVGVVKTGQAHSGGGRVRGRGLGWMASVGVVAGIGGWLAV